MSHYHFLNEKSIVSDGTPKIVTLHYIVAKDYAAQEQAVATEMGYTVKWNECWEGLCFNEGRANTPR